jgi:hypothetical protein
MTEGLPATSIFCAGGEKETQRGCAAHSLCMRLLLAVALLYAASHTLAASYASTIIFKGFRYGWEREILGFDTPHRLGSIALSKGKSRAME